MFDLIPRWALALGVGAVSAAGVGTVAFGTLDTSKPACVSGSSAVIESSACATADAATALASIDPLRAQLAGALGGATNQVQGIVANAMGQVAGASTATQS